MEPQIMVLNWRPSINEHSINSSGRCAEENPVCFFTSGEPGSGFIKERNE
jgi:hypothetical protein